MKKITDIFSVFKKGFKKKDEDSFDDVEEIDDSAKEMDVNTPEGNKSMRQGNHGQIFGLDRKIINGIA